MHYATYVSEMYRAGIECVPLGQWGAAAALHLLRSRVCTSVILPQALSRSIPALTNYSIVLFKDVPPLARIMLSSFTVGREIVAGTFVHFSWSPWRACSVCRSRSSCPRWAGSRSAS
ncbi:hypothetical protein LWC34_55900 [Kibdelosporangium philippinense]|uniref:Binding-protein-dependent transport system inner membrane component n=1 Tax=Kibdelosporangium philippinense TaxID=211113 RepID=A0ABS8ZWE8_9PSEU|nr:hypothetical protein [Kibdelosporangium philippinense]MCE7012038.1 hypothetical protein [Kibdelosporangium philippinense]